MTDLLAFCRRWNMLPPGCLVLCAVSGGRDSMALLHLLLSLGEEEGFRVAAAHFNHRLRPAADGDEALVRDWCGARGVPFSRGEGSAADFAAREGLSLEEAARVLRYRFLEDAADQLGAARIATAHHREDNAETVLLNLLRGAGLRGLGGIPPVRGRIVRPLLETGRDDINRYISQHGIPFAEDETNRSRDYTRNRLRLEVLPLLEDIAPGCAARMAGTAALLREEEEHLAREAAALLPEAAADETALPVPVLAAQDGAMARRLTRGMARALGAELTRAQTEAVLTLKTGGRLDLPGGLRALRDRERLVLRRQAPPPPPLLLREGTQVWGSWRITLTRRRAPAEAGPEELVLRDTGGALTAALWDGKGRLEVENGSRTAKRLLRDGGVPPEERDGRPGVYLDGVLAALPGAGTDWSLRPEAGAPCWVITFARITL